MGSGADFESRCILVTSLWSRSVLTPAKWWWASLLCHRSMSRGNVVAADAYSANGTVEPSKNAALLLLMLAMKSGDACYEEWRCLLWRVEMLATKSGDACYEEWSASRTFKGHLRRSNVHSKSNVSIQITLEDDSQCTVLLCIYLITDLGDDSQCTRGKAVQLQIKYLSR